MKRQASVGMLYLYTILIVIAVMAMASCSTSKGCNYKKVQKFNQKQMRKYHRHADNNIKGRASALLFSFGPQFEKCVWCATCVYYHSHHTQKKHTSLL